MLTNTFTMQPVTNYRKWFLIKRDLWGRTIGNPKDLWKALKSLGLPNKLSSCEVKALKINNTVEHHVNSVLEDSDNYYKTLAENLVQLLPKPPNKSSTLLLKIINIL